jgi:large subunit ribosomal protein L24
MKIKKKIAKLHIKVGDKVQIMTGDEKGKIGKIISIFRINSKVVVEGIVPRIKYIKTKENGESTKEIPICIHISNLMLWDAQKGKASRIGYKFLNNKKERYLKASGNFLNN